MNFKQLEYFIAVADAGSISAAARSLHISQPPLSTQMHLLEEELDQSLFERGSRSIKLTDAGRFFYERAQSILDMAEGTRKDMEQLGKGLIGTLRLGMISSVQTGTVIENIARFRQDHPGVLFRIYEGNTYHLLDKLSTGQIHAALVRTPFPEEGLECRYLIREPMIAVGQERFLGKEESPVSPDDLARFPLIIYRRWEQVLHSYFTHPVPEYLCICDDARSCLSWAKSGAGVSIVPASILHQNRENLRARALSPILSSTIALVQSKNAGPFSLGQQFFQSFGLS